MKDVTALHGVEINEAVSRVVNGGWYLQGKENEHLNNPLVALPDLLPDEQNAYHLFPNLVGVGKRDALHDYLEQNGVGTACHYPIAPHKQLVNKFC